MSDILISDTASFKIEVPYKVIETGDKGEKPLIIYLHGYNQNIEYLCKKAEPLLNIRAFHLFMQGPYPIVDTSRKLNVSKWGRAWYLYDGDQDQFIRSMEESSQFIQKVVGEVTQKIQVSRICVFGYSMGGYLGGYFTLSRPKLMNDLIMVGARIKTEVFKEELDLSRHINILALHGKNDDSVYPEPQEKCIEHLKQNGINATFKLTNAGHRLESVFIEEAKNWLLRSGYIEC